MPVQIQKFARLTFLRLSQIIVFVPAYDKSFQAVSLFFYFPIQNLEKISFTRSSETSSPIMEPRDA